MTVKEISEAIKYYECERNGAIVVLDSGFGTHEGEHNFLYKRKKLYAETAIQALEKELERVENKSLSIDEIKNCIGEPLWVELKDGTFECLVLKDFNDSAFEFEDSVIFYSEDEPKTYIYKYKRTESEE